MKALTNKTLTVLGIAVIAALMAVPPAFARSDAGIDRWAANAMRDSGRYRPLDPWAYNAIHAAAGGPADVITEHSAGQHPTVGLALPVSLPAMDETGGFSFRDAGIGAAAAVVVLLVLASSLILRRRRVLQAL